MAPEVFFLVQEQQDQSATKPGILPDEHLDTVLECASRAPENPWFAAQVLARLPSETQGSAESFFSRVWALFATPVRRALALAGLVALAAGSAILYEVKVVPDASSVAKMSGEIQETLTAPELTDDLIVADLEVFMADLQADLWQSEISL